MRQLCTASSLAVSLVLMALSGARAAEPAAGKLRVGPAIQEAARDDLVVEVLDNGACLAVMRAPTKGVVSVQMWIGAGSTTEGRWANRGISHFVEHMLFEGTTREPGRGFDALVKSVGGSHNGYTSLEETVYHVTVPSPGYEKVLRALVEMVHEAGIPKDRFDRERDVVLQELREGEDDVGRLSGRLLRETVFRVHPYRNRVGGDIAAFEALTHEDLVAYYESLYVPGNEIIVIAGDVDMQEALRIGREVASKAQPSALPDVERPIEPEQLAPRFAHRETPLARSVRINFAWRTVDLLHPDLHALDVLAMALGQGRSSRLYRVLKEELGLALSIGAFSWTPRDEGYLGLWMQCTDGKGSELRAAVGRQVEHLREWGITYDELERAKSQVEAGMVFRRQTAEGVAHNLASDLLFTGDPFFSDTYLASVRSVTADDILRVARTYLTDSRMTVSELAPEHSRAEEPAHAPDTEASTADGRTAPAVLSLPGGMRLVLIKDDTLPMISLSATLLAGLRLEPAGKAGMSAMLSELLIKGTRARSAAQLAADIEGRGGTFSSLSGRNSLSVQVEMLSGDLAEALDAAAEMLAQPLIATEDVEQVRTETLAAIEARSERAWSATGELLRKTLYKGHPYQNPDTGTAETVASIQRRDLVAFHKSIARRGNLVVSIAGHFDAEEAVALSQKAFSRLSGGSLREPTIVAAAPPDTQTRVEKSLPGTRSAVILWGFPGATLGSKDSDALSLVAEVLGGMSGRLWTAVREEEGLAYAVGAFDESQVDPGMFALYCATRPEWESRAMDAIRAELVRLVEEPPSEKELADAKKGLAGHEAISLQSRGSVALRTALYERYGLGARAALNLEERLSAITVEDVLTTVKKYIDPRGGVVAVVVPAPGEREDE
jgi:zinc protease